MHRKPSRGGWFSRELKLLPVFFGLIFSFNFSFSDNTSALFVPTLSASVNQANLQVNGNQVINSTSKTTEIPLNFTVNTNNKTGYTATLNSETNETALVNAGSTSGAKINSISNDLSLSNLPNNTWGYKFGPSTNYAPIPALSTPAQILQTTGKTNGNETNNLKLGMKLGETLESGSYKNKLIFSILTNNYERMAIMTEGPAFNNKLKSLETATNKIEHFKKSSTPPATTANAKNIEDEGSDYEIKLWLDPTDKTAYYYAEPEKVYLNEDSSQMFHFDRSVYPYDKMNDILDVDLSNFDTSQVTTMNQMFNSMEKLTSLDLSNFDTSKVTNMYAMFSDMRSLTTLNLSSFDTSKVTNMRSMFLDVSRLTSLNISNFNTSKVTDMGFMFYDMSSLTSLNLSNFNTSKVTDMRAMFHYVSRPTSLDLSSFDTSKVTNMRGMFFGMSSLTSLNLSNFNTSKVTDMGYMFYDMSSLTSLNLSNFDTYNVTDMDHMFALSYEDKDKLEIYVNNDFDTSQLSYFSNMFTNRKKLRGGNGSYLADPSTADKTWLRVDRPGVQGYFTRKS